MSAALKQKASIVKFPSKWQKKGVVVDNYESIKSSYGYLARADRAGNLNLIQKQVLDFCLQLTAQRGWVSVDYDYMEEKFGRCRNSIKRILNSISNIISWEFRRSVRIDGRRKDNQVIISRTKYTEEILSKAKEDLSNKRPKISRFKYQNVRSSVYQHAPLHIDNKRGIEDNPLKRVISSIPDNGEKRGGQTQQKSTVRELSEDLPCCEAASHSSSSEVTPSEKQSKQEIAKGVWQEAHTDQSKLSCAKILPFTAKEEKEHYRKHANRKTQSSQEGEFTLIAGFFNNIKLERREPNPLKLERDQTEKQQLGNNENKNTTKELETKEQSEEVTEVRIELKETSCASWDLIRRKALSSVEHEVDRWSLKHDFNELEVYEDNERYILEFKGSDYAIKNIRKNHYQAFTTSFYKILPNYTFEFVKL